MLAICFQKAEGGTKTSWNERSELCLLKVITLGRFLFLAVLFVWAEKKGNLNKATLSRICYATSTICCEPISLSCGLYHPLVFLSFFSLQIFGIKTLVKSYLPVKDSNVRPGIDGLLEILRNILSFGEMSNDIESR